MNRTRVELKQKIIKVKSLKHKRFESNQGGIETSGFVFLDKQSLKFESNQGGIETSAKISFEVSNTKFESNQGGIETLNQAFLIFSLQNLNRTRVELKPKVTRRLCEKV